MPLLAMALFPSPDPGFNCFPSSVMANPWPMALGGASKQQCTNYYSAPTLVAFLPEPSNLVAFPPRIQTLSLSLLPSSGIVMHSSSHHSAAQVRTQGTASLLKPAAKPHVLSSITHLPVPSHSVAVPAVSLATEQSASARELGELRTHCNPGRPAGPLDSYDVMIPKQTFFPIHSAPVTLAGASR